MLDKDGTAVVVYKKEQHSILDTNDAEANTEDQMQKEESPDSGQRIAIACGIIK